jgi:pullulanase/glycogen debranching enzyme
MLGWFLCASVLAATTPDTSSLDDCNATDFQTVLLAAPGTSALAANAYWLTRDLVQWPGAAATGSFRLYHSASGQIVSTKGKKLEGADGALALHVFNGDVPASAASRFKFVAHGLVLALDEGDRQKLPSLLRQQLVLVQEDAVGHVIKATATQAAGALDDLYAAATLVNDLGVSVRPSGTTFKLWAPTAQRVTTCIFKSGSSVANARVTMQFDARTGIWQAQQATDLSGSYYRFVLDVLVLGAGLVRNRVTDPYAISATTDSVRSYIADLAAPNLKPKGWDDQTVADKVRAPTDMVVYELHVRDFSANDDSVSPAFRGKFKAFTQNESNGMKHLRALSAAGVTDVHLLPIFDFATVAEGGCTTPVVLPGLPDGESRQAQVMAQADKDCFNWGYDPFHFNAPEGSYATDAADGAVRVRELREMVMALHGAGLRVGMDVVYNHTAASGQHEKSVLDRIVPGYYHRLDSNGVVERSTCCDNTASENLMMAKLMTESVVQWATQYRIDSFRFDLMAHQPRSVMEALQSRVNQASGRQVQLIGEGWNFGEVENGARFVQASQLSLNGSGIGTFSDRGRDAVRGGSAMDSGVDLIKRQGYINGLFYDPNALAEGVVSSSDLGRVADLVRVGLAGSVRDVRLTTALGEVKALQKIDYAGQPAGYVSQPGEVVNYVENHDNQTLFDINVYKLPVSTSHEDRVRVQMLGAAINMFSQGIAYFHAGMETLRSKSMDGNSYDSGDWFNRIDWRFQDNYFGSGLPPKGDNGRNYVYIQPLLNNPSIKPTPKDIALARDMFLDLLKIRASTTLLRLRSAQDIKDRLHFYNTGPGQEPTVLAVHLDGRDYPGAVFKELIYFINVDTRIHELTLSAEQGKYYQLHPVHLAGGTADQRVVSQARYDQSTGRFTVPARTALVYVVH